MRKIGGKKWGICVRMAEKERLQRTQGDCVDESGIGSGHVSKEVIEAYSVKYESARRQRTDYLMMRIRMSQCLGLYGEGQWVVDLPGKETGYGMELLRQLGAACVARARWPHSVL